MRCSATACAMTAAASRMAGRATGSSARRAGPESRSSRQAQSVTSAAAAAAVNQRSATSIARARPWERAQQEQVVGAVGPAVGVEEGVPEQRQAERDERGLQVDGEHQRPARLPRAAGRSGRRAPGGAAAGRRIRRRAWRGCGPAGVPCPSRPRPARTRPDRRARPGRRSVLPGRLKEVTRPATTSASPAATVSVAARPERPA